MRKPLLRLYAPFIALALVQAAFIVAAPSKGNRQVAASGPLSFDNGANGAAASSQDGTATGAAGTTDNGATGATGGGATGGGGVTTGGGGGATATAGGAPGATGATPGAKAPAPGAKTPVGDTTHCKNGRQFDTTYYAPPCVPKFTGKNPGATAPGVTDKEIKVVWFREKPNEQVNAILRTQGLAATEEELYAFRDAAIDFIKSHYEFYGRTLKVITIVGDCPQTPPDIPKCKEAARQVTAQKPFMVIWATPLYSAVFDEWAKAGIISLGGWHFDANLFNSRRPFRYDFTMDGTRSAKVIADYYCKKLANKNADHSGPVIHPTIGARGQVKRKLGIITPDDPANISTAKLVQSLVNQCQPGGAGEPYKYESDINRAAEQTNATVAGLIRDKATTVVCMCDPIAPVFGTKGFTSQNYFPELLISGMGFSDYDQVGRLYDTQQMAHAFGPSHLSQFLPFSQQDHSKVWRAAGRQGDPCSTCGLVWAYFQLAANLLQSAGPTLTPATVERGAFALPPRGGEAYYPLIKIGPNDYTGIDDTREVYWSSAAISTIDGGRRFPIGQWPRDFKIPAPAS